MNHALERINSKSARCLLPENGARASALSLALIALNQVRTSGLVSDLLKDDLSVSPAVDELLHRAARTDGIERNSPPLPRATSSSSTLTRATCPRESYPAFRSKLLVREVKYGGGMA